MAGSEMRPLQLRMAKAAVVAADTDADATFSIRRSKRSANAPE